MADMKTVLRAYSSRPRRLWSASPRAARCALRSSRAARSPFPALSAAIAAPRAAAASAADTTVTMPSPDSAWVLLASCCAAASISFSCKSKQCQETVSGTAETGMR